MNHLNYIVVKPYIGKVSLVYRNTDQIKVEVDLTKMVEDYEDLLGPMESTPAVLKSVMIGLDVDSKITDNLQEFEIEYYIINNTLEEIIKYAEKI